MGKKLILVVFTAIFVIGGIFTALSQKSLRSAESTADQGYWSLARNIANTYGNVMMTNLQNHLSTSPISNTVPPPIDGSDVLDVPGSRVNVQVYRNNISYPDLGDDEYLIVSTATVTSAMGEVYTFETHILYEYANEMRANYLALRDDETPLDTGNPGAIRFRNDRIEYIRLGGNALTSAHPAAGTTPQQTVWSFNSEGVKPIHFENLRIPHVIILGGDVRIVSLGSAHGEGIDRSVMIIALNDMFIETNVFPTPGSGAKIVLQAGRDIYLGGHAPNPRPLNRIEADLYAKGRIRPGRDYTNINASIDPPLVENTGGRLFPNQSQLYTWNPEEHPEGPNDPTSWVFEEHNVSEVRSWQELPSQRRRGRQ
ncbi:MAG: hypothetical protein FWG98_03035 [Candidatus Cloacimonetes bacterium]|nr:hypothetical protein [Candidatus Cloacimonadota bacterium]